MANKKLNAKHRYYFFKKWFTAENIRTLIFCIIIFIFFCDAIAKKSFNLQSLVDGKLLFSLILLFISDWISVTINMFIQNKYEDYAKLSDDYISIVKKYQLSKLVKYEFGNNSILLPYELVVDMNNFKSILIRDSKDKMYELPKQICGCSDYVFDVHKGSIVYNNINIRLDNIIMNDSNIELVTSRTYYYDSLITNRACDLILKNGKSIREIFEPGPYIKPLNLTKMSNHIGFNGLVLTSDRYVPLIMRGRDVSIAKGALSSSISASLKTKYAVDRSTLEFTTDGLASAIKNEILDELNITIDEFSNAEVLRGIKCFYRDLIECGKPQFFVYYNISYNKDSLAKSFYGSDKYNETFLVGENEKKMRKDGKEILFFTPDELFNAKLLHEDDDTHSGYRYDKIIIRGKTYNITPGTLLSIQLLKTYM